MALLPPDPVYVLRTVDSTAMNTVCIHQDQRALGGNDKGFVHLFDLHVSEKLIFVLCGN